MFNYKKLRAANQKVEEYYQILGDLFCHDITIDGVRIPHNIQQYYTNRRDFARGVLFYASVTKANHPAPKVVVVETPKTKGAK